MKDMSFKQRYMSKDKLTSNSGDTIKVIEASSIEVGERKHKVNLNVNRNGAYKSHIATYSYK